MSVPENIELARENVVENFLFDLKFGSAWLP